MAKKANYERLKEALEKILKNYPEDFLSTVVIPREVIEKSLQAVDDCLEMGLKGD